MFFEFDEVRPKHLPNRTTGTIEHGQDRSVLVNMDHVASVRPVHFEDVRTILTMKDGTDIWTDNPYDTFFRIFKNSNRIAEY